MSNRTYVYAVHIATTPEWLWEALTSHAFTKQYFPEWRFESTWKTGSPGKFLAADGSLYSQGEIVEADPPRTLCYTWPESAEANRKGPPERLTWKIAPSGPGTVKLTLIHEELTEEWYDRVTQGWSAVLSSLKSLLEVGKPLAIDKPLGGAPL